MWRDYLSRIGIITLVLGDSIVGYLATGSFLSIPIIMAILAGGTAILFIIDLLSLRANPLSKCRSIEANRLTKNFNIIKQLYETTNRRCPNIKLYIAPSPTRNAFSLGSRIIMTKGMLDSENDSVVQAVLLHELAHTCHLDSFFSALLQVNLIVACCIFLMAEFGTILIFGFLLFILLCMACSRFAAISITGIITRLVRAFSRLFLRVLVLLHNIVSAIFFRSQEYAADAFTVKFNRSLAMKLFLESIAQSEGIESSLTERLLSDHPDPYSRIANIEKAESQAVQIQSI